MSKFRTMTLKSEHEYPSPLASTSSITLEDPLSRSPLNVKVEGVGVNNIEGDPVKPRRPSPSPALAPDSRSMMNDDDDAKPEYPLTLKSEPRTSTSTSASASPRTGSTTPSVPTTTTTTKLPPLKKKGPQLIGDLPISTEEAMKTFVQIEENHYQYSTLGRSREALESMTCECPPNGRRTLFAGTTRCCIFDSLKTHPQILFASKIALID